MKTITITAGQIGLVFRNGSLTKVLKEGKYWIRFNSRVMLFDLSKPFVSSIELNVLLKDKELAQMLDIIEIQDKEIGLLYENKNFKQVLKPGRYAFWKEIMEYNCIKADISKVHIGENIDKNLFSTPELSQFVRVLSIEPYEKALLYIDEKFVEVLDPGDYFYWKNNTKIKLIKTDMRNQQIEVSGQEILSKDKASLRINFFARYRVVDILKALKENKDFTQQIYVLMQLALREYIGTQNLDELLDNKESIASYVQDYLKEKVQKLGIEILDSGVKDIILPGDVKEIMNQVLVAQKKAQANIITRREETASTRSLLNTAKLMEDNAMLFKLKEMEYVEKIADKINTISLSGGNQVVQQLKEIFSTSENG